MQTNLFTLSKIMTKISRLHDIYFSGFGLDTTNYFNLIEEIINVYVKRVLAAGIPGTQPADYHTMVLAPLQEN